MDPKGYERLSAQDASFLVFETPETPMNVGGASIFEGGPRLGRGGDLDIERIKRHIASRLHRVPRYRQRLAYVPVANEPVWIDDDRFDIDYHVRHIALPRRDGDRALKRLTADILAQPLDRAGRCGSSGWWRVSNAGASRRSPRPITAWSTACRASTWRW